MSKKIKYDQYQLLLQFKTQNCFNITAEYLPTNEHFSNNTVELMRINKETVLASLEKKSQKNLRCDFQQYFQEGKKYLKIVFIVNFDFLPEFRQQLHLQFVQFKQSLKKISMISMRAQVDQIEKALDSFQLNGTTIYKQLTMMNAITSGQKKQIFSKDVKQGKYIFRFSGMIMNTQGAGQADKFSINIFVPGQADHKQLSFKSHHQPSYYFPFFASEIVECKQGEFKVEMSTNMANTNITNVHFVMNRVVEVN